MVDETKETKAKDNNKRLALLEGGVAGLAAVLGELGVTVAEGADPIVLVIELAKGQAAKIDLNDEKILELIGASTGVIARFAPDMELAPLNEAETLIDCQIRLLKQVADIEGSPGEIAAIARADAAAAALGELEPKVAAVGDYLIANYPAQITADECSLSQATRILGEETSALAAANKEIGDLNIDIEQLEGQIEALGSAGKAEDVEAAPGRERPEGARDFGPAFGALDRGALVALFGDGDVGLEISFSNGDYELVELAPVAIKVSDLTSVEGRFMVPVIHVRGGEHREDLHGAALVHEREQIAYCSFPSPIVLEAKQERRFEKTITFG